MKAHWKTNGGKLYNTKVFKCLLTGVIGGETATYPHKINKVKVKIHRIPPVVTRP